jgi:hypothetical protein
VRQRRIGSCWPLLAMAPILSRLLRTKTRSHFRSTLRGWGLPMRCGGTEMIVSSFSNGARNTVASSS